MSADRKRARPDRRGGGARAVAGDAKLPARHGVAPGNGAGRINDGLRSKASRSPGGIASTTSRGYSTRCPLTLSAIAGGRRAKHASQRPAEPVGRNRRQLTHRSRRVKGLRTGFRR